MKRLQEIDVRLWGRQLTEERHHASVAIRLIERRIRQIDNEIALIMEQEYALDEAERSVTKSGGLHDH